MFQTSVLKLCVMKDDRASDLQGQEVPRKGHTPQTQTLPEVQPDQTSV